MKMKRLRHQLLLITVVLVAGAAMSMYAGDRSFVGTKKCKGCHLKEWKSWSATRMAGTFEVLEAGERAKEKLAAGLDPKKDYTKDKACLPCHVTGYGKPGGFVDLETTPDLAGVGCEMCHGPGGTYTGEGHMTLKNKEYKRADLVKLGLVGEITEAECRGCHNSDSPFVGDDYVFDFKSRKADGTHEKFPLKYQH
jgi:hypothetical protein